MGYAFAFIVAVIIELDQVIICTKADIFYGYNNWIEYFGDWLQLIAFGENSHVAT